MRYKLQVQGGQSHGNKVKKVKKGLKMPDFFDYLSYLSVSKNLRSQLLLYSI